MAPFLMLLAWYLAGVFGAYLVWADMQRISHRQGCPTRRQTLVMAFCGLLGILSLGAGIVVTVVAFLEGNIGFTKEWWNEPIC